MNLSKFQQLFAKTGMVTDLDFGDEGEFEAVTTLWGHEIDVGIMYGYDEDDEPDFELFNKNLHKLENRLTWINENKTLIAEYLMNETGQFDWINEQIEEKGSIKIEDKTISSPITDDDIIKSLTLIGVRFFMTSDNEFDGERLECELSLTCKPDYLFGHIATMEIDGDDELLAISMDG